MSFKTKLQYLILAWLITVIILLSLHIFRILEVQYTIKNLLIIIFWMGFIFVISLIKYFNRKKLVDHLSFHYPEQYYKYAYSKFWNERHYNRLKLKIFILSKELDEDPKIKEHKKIDNYYNLVALLHFGLGLLIIYIIS